MFLKTSVGIFLHKKAHLGSAIGMWWRCGGLECFCYSLDVFVVAEYCICIVEHDVFVAAQDIFVGWLQMEHGCAAPPPQASLLPVHWKAAFRSRDQAVELFKSGASPSAQKVLLFPRTEILDHTINRMIIFNLDHLEGSACSCCKENGPVHQLFNEPDHSNAQPVERGRIFWHFLLCVT